MLFLPNSTAPGGAAGIGVGPSEWVDLRKWRVKTGIPFRVAMLVHGETFETKKNHLLMFGRLSFFARCKFLIVIYSEQATEISSSTEPAAAGVLRHLGGNIN